MAVRFVCLNILVTVLYSDMIVVLKILLATTGGCVGCGSFVFIAGRIA